MAMLWIIYDRKDVQNVFDGVYQKGILYKMLQISLNSHIVMLLQRKDGIFKSRSGQLWRSTRFNFISSFDSIFISDFPHENPNSTGLIASHMADVNNYYDNEGITINTSKCQTICTRNASRRCMRFVVPESKELIMVLRYVLREVLII